MKGQVSFGLDILDASLVVGRDVDVRTAFLTIKNNVVHHCAAQLLSPSTQVVDQDRNEIQRAVKYLARACFTRRVEIVPAGAIGERWRAKNRSCTLNRQFGSGIAGTFCVLLLRFATKFFRLIESKLLMPRALPWPNI